MNKNRLNKTQKGREGSMMSKLAAAAAAEEEEEEYDGIELTNLRTRNGRLAGTATEKLMKIDVRLTS